MQHLITKLHDKINVQDPNNYTPISLKELMNLCITYKINSYYGVFRNNQQPPKGELTNTNDRTFTIWIHYDNITEAKIVEVSLKHIMEYYMPLVDDNNKIPLVDTSIRINRNTRIALTYLKDKNESYDNVISKLVFAFCSEHYY